MANADCSAGEEFVDPDEDDDKDWEMAEADKDAAGENEGKEDEDDSDDEEDDADYIPVCCPCQPFQLARNIPIPHTAPVLDTSILSAEIWMGEHTDTPHRDIPISPGEHGRGWSRRR
jgi:hypothetical protein